MGYYKLVSPLQGSMLGAFFLQRLMQRSNAQICQSIAMQLSIPWIPAKSMRESINIEIPIHKFIFVQVVKRYENFLTISLTSALVDKPSTIGTSSTFPPYPSTIFRPTT